MSIIRLDPTTSERKDPEFWLRAFTLYMTMAGDGTYNVEQRKLFATIAANALAMHKHLLRDAYGDGLKAGYEEGLAE